MQARVRIKSGDPCVCKVCGIAFMPYRKNPKGNENTCCSLRCFGISRRKTGTCRAESKSPIVVECPECGVTHETKGNSKTGLCRPCITRRAGVASRSQHPLTGANNPLWKGGITKDWKTWLKKWKVQYRQKNPLQQKARDAVKSAISKGVITKTACERCGSEQDIQGHHHAGYEPENWLKVMWLCRTCHNKAHGKLKHLMEEGK